MAKRGAGRLPPDTHVVHLRGGDFPEVQASLDGEGGKARVVLHSADALLGDREEQFAVPHQARGRIVHLRIVEAKGDHAATDSSKRRIGRSCFLTDAPGSATWRLSKRIL